MGRADHGFEEAAMPPETRRLVFLHLPGRVVDGSSAPAYSTSKPEGVRL